MILRPNKTGSSKNKNHIDRRSFIKLTGLAGLGLALNSAIPLLAKSLGKNPDLHRVSNTRLAMGTTVTMILIYQAEQEARDAIERAFKEIERLSALMDHYKEGTEVSLLNKNGILSNASQEVIEVVSKAIRYYRLTKGAFDITIYPVIDLFKRSFSKGKNSYPERDEIRDVLELVGSDNIEIDGRGIRFKKKGMKITLDGIAKGYIVDKASKILLDHGIKRHLINAGGDIMAVGLREDMQPWRVAIQDPKKRNNHLDVIDLMDASVATSGNYENYFDRDMLYYHIADPKTGLSPVITSSASVIATTATDADALATALMVMGSEKGTMFIDSLAGYESLIITRDNRIRRSAGWVSRK
jgi:thiamine biosynthesis lipoprotein